ncbi:hypothetical protein L3X38_009959 [Prunus dulcis]|uniref:Uncharacterized protein n=1 Tax=Prunus dulcis TaxID=3755 RepID=A0AAD4ZDR9_PRUDU|nr:hypothetical protein L3X38_009959 [Prunus dulcis]
MWSDKCEEGCVKLKNRSTTALISVLQEVSGNFVSYSVALQPGLGFVLIQHGRQVIPEQHKSSGFLQPLSISEGKREQPTMDFVFNLPEHRGTPAPPQGTTGHGTGGVRTAVVSPFFSYPSPPTARLVLAEKCRKPPGGHQNFIVVDLPPPATISVDPGIRDQADLQKRPTGGLASSD